MMEFFNCAALEKVPRRFCLLVNSAKKLESVRLLGKRSDRMVEPLDDLGHSVKIQCLKRIH